MDMSEGTKYLRKGDVIRIWEPPMVAGARVEVSIDDVIDNGKSFSVTIRDGPSKGLTKMIKSNTIREVRRWHRVVDNS